MKITYKVEVTGHEAPFKWKVHNPTHRGMGAGFTGGEADTYEDALFFAAAAARNLEWERKHRETVRTEVLFEIETVPEGDPLCNFDCQLRGGPHDCMCPPKTDPLPGGPDEEY